MPLKARRTPTTSSWATRSRTRATTRRRGELHAQFKYTADADATRMNIQTGEITGTIAGGQIARTIEGYKMVRSTVNDTDNNKIAADKSFRVSNLLFPLDNIAADENNHSKNIEVVISIQRMKADGAEAYYYPTRMVRRLILLPQGYPLPFDVSTHTAWEAGKNYTYTIKFTGNSLSIETVTVEDW